MQTLFLGSIRTIILVSASLLHITSHASVYSLPLFRVLLECHVVLWMECMSGSNQHNLYTIITYFGPFGHYQAIYKSVLKWHNGQC
jgi:hypothetical protein